MKARSLCRWSSPSSWRLRLKEVEADPQPARERADRHRTRLVHRVEDLGHEADSGDPGTRYSAWLAIKARADISPTGPGASFDRIWRPRFYESSRPGPPRPGRPASRRHKKGPCGARGHRTADPGQPAPETGGAVDRSLRPRSVRHMSATTATRPPAAAHDATRRHNEQTARRPRSSQARGRFSWWWQVLGSNQRRLSRRFYRGHPLSFSEPVLLGRC